MASHCAQDIEPHKDNCAAAAQHQHQMQQQAASTASAEAFFSGWSEAKRYTVQEVIGKGSYGVVCAAIDNQTKERVAIKKIQNVFDNVADATRILREVKLLRLLKHPDVVEIKHIMLPPDPRTFKDIYVVFELLESDLHTVIGANDDLTQDHHKVFLYQLLRGLNFIHASGVLHRDLKPKNILANSNCKLKICDFGLARPLLDDTGVSPVHWTDYVATRWYRAPELCGCFYGRYSQAVDIWSIGCIFAEVLLGKPLFPGRDAVSQLQLITDLLGKPSNETIERIGNQKARHFLYALPAKPAKSFQQKFANASPAALALLQRLLAFDPKDRPTAAEALADPYFASLPNATMQEPAHYSRQHFEFEMRKLDTAEVRALIYQEALAYHPLVAAAYQAQQAAAMQAGFPMQRPPGHSVPGGEMEMRHQFRMLEQQAAMQAAAAAAGTASCGMHHAQQMHLQQQQHMTTSSTVSAASNATAYHKEQEQLYQQQQQALAQQQQRHYHAVLPPPAPVQQQQAMSCMPQQGDAYSAALWYKQQQALLQTLQANDALGLLSPEQQAAVLQYGYQQRLASVHALSQAMGH